MSHRLQVKRERAVELSFRRIVFQSQDDFHTAKPGRKYRRVIAYGRAIIRDARTPVILRRANEREIGANGQGGR